MSKLIAVILLLIISSSVQAFKVDSHVWIGQQVINDLADDGKLTFKLNEKIIKLDVDPAVTNAILNNQAAFLMGNLGPDAIPDAVVGQTVVHPGLESGWKTNDWLIHLLQESTGNEVGMAVSYGYLGHAAADVFAHTYVNQYAGDVFDIADNESLAEQRHMILEGYIGKHMPPMRDVMGNDLGAPWQPITLNREYAEFVRDTLIYHSAVQAQYRQAPYATHMVAFTEFRNAIDALAEDGIWHELDVMVALLIAGINDIEISTDEASEIVNKANEIIDKVNSGVTDNLQELDNQLLAYTLKYDNFAHQALLDAADNMRQLEEDLLTKKHELENVVVELSSKVIPNCPQVFVPDGGSKWVCHQEGLFGECIWGDWVPTGSWKDELICAGEKAIIISSIAELSEKKQKLEDEILGVEGNDGINAKLIDAVGAVRDESQKALQNINAIVNAIVDLGQAISGDVSPIQSVLRNWRSDIDLAMGEYVVATSQSLINTMNPNANSLDPIYYWFDCYHMSMIGVPQVVSGCEFRDSIAELKQAIDSIVVIVDEYASLKNIINLPGLTELKELRDREIDRLKNKLAEEVGDQVVDILPPHVQEIIELFAVDVNDATLNSYFSKAETVQPAKGLIMIPDMAERVKSEMSLVNGKLDPERYPVIYNALVLAKLALLERWALKELASQAGVDNQLFDLLLVDNAVATAFENIDGNHQWMEFSPPLPSTNSDYSEVPVSYDSESGFLPWADHARDKLFRGMFIGPLSAGIDAPEIVRKAEIVASNYPYDPCAANPYPDDVSDKTCTVIKLIPILTMLLH